MTEPDSPMQTNTSEHATQTLNRRGQWVPAIPLPLLGPRKCCCVCRQGFWTAEGYQGHYALRHILHMPGEK